MNERGVILLAVLLTLTLIAALAALMLRIGGADVASLRAERAVLQRQVLLQSALVQLAGQLPAQDGTETVLTLPGGQVDARVFAAEGLLNPNRTRPGLLQAGLVALGLTAARAEAVTRAMLSARKAANRPAFADEAALRALFTAPEWQKVRLGLTLLGRAETPDPARAPAWLRPLLQTQTVDFAGAALGGVHGFYDLWLHPEGPLDATDAKGRLWTHVAALLGRDGRWHVIRTGWPEVLP